MSKTRLSKNYRWYGPEFDAAHMKRLLANQNRIRAEEEALTAAKKDPGKVKSGDADKIIQDKNKQGQ